MRRPRRSLAADLLDLLAVALLVPLLGGAVDGAAVRAATVTSAAWAAAAAPAGGATPGGPLTLTWSQGGQPAVAEADVVATGTLDLSRVILQLGVSNARDTGAATVVACLGGAWIDATCAGGQTLALGTLASPTAVDVALAPGARLALRATAPRSAAGRSLFSLHVTVPRAAARVGTIRTS